MAITTEFLYRNVGGSYANAFSQKEDTPMRLPVKDQKDVALLMSKGWIQWVDAEVGYLPLSCIICAAYSSYLSTLAGGVGG